MKTQKRRASAIDSGLYFLTLQHNHTIISTWPVRMTSAVLASVKMLQEMSIFYSEANNLSQMSNKEKVLLAFYKTLTFPQ